MDEERFHHGYVNQTVLHPLGLLAIIILGAAMLLLPRRYAIVPMMVMACFIAPAQRVAVFTLNFDLLRIMVLFGTVRILAYGEWRGFEWRPLDYVLALWAFSGAVAYIVLYGTMDAAKYRLGTMYDAIGMYFLFRLLVKTWQDLDAIVLGFIVISLPVALAFLVELATGHNPFAILGGVAELTPVREGRVRCQGAFAHSILAGCFWASLMPMMAALWWRGGQWRTWCAVGLFASLLVVGLCASSTPVSAVLFGAIAAMVFPFRGWMRSVRWTVVLLLVLLHLVMKAPVWHLISRVDLVGGSTGWQRYHLIDATIKNFADWWAVGTQSTEKWGDGLYDVTNQFILEGVRGGAVTLALYLCMIALAFRNVGRLCRSAGGDRPKLVFAWALGVALFIHCMNFMAVSYFGQIQMVWYLLLATIASLESATQLAPVDVLPAPHRTSRARLITGSASAFLSSSSQF